jgi:hypothetical protein
MSPGQSAIQISPQSKQQDLLQLQLSKFGLKWNNSSLIQHNAVPSNLTERDQDSEKISELYLHKGARDAQRFAPAVPGSLSPAVSVQLHRPGRQAAKRLSESSIEEKAARTG